MKLYRLPVLLAIIGLLSMGVAKAQSTSESTADNGYDPIGAMLDSLVTLNHVVRFNNLDANCYDAINQASGVNPYVSDAQYKERMERIKSPIPLSYNQYVKNFIDLYASRKRGLTQRAMGLANLYFPMYEEIMDREGIPLEMKYLSIVESALNPLAVSRCGATGLWQFMYNTGVLYNLKVNSFTDDRRDPYKATMAACQYFKDMYNIYGDWLLVIASYNCGAGNVNKAIRRSGGKTNFWEIMPYLPAETRGYVPAFIAVTYVMNYSREHNLFPVMPAYSYFEVDTVTVNRQVNFSVLANQLDLPQEVVSYLNPVYKKSYIPEGGNYTLRLPVNKIAQFIRGQEDIYTASAPQPKPILPDFLTKRDDDLTADASDAGGVRYQTITRRVIKTITVKKGESLAVIADRYDCSVKELKKMNKLRSGSIHKGQKLKVEATITKRILLPAATNDQAVAVRKADSTTKQTNSDSAASKEQMDSTEADSAQLAQNASADTENQSQASDNKQGTRFIYHLVQPGDTLWNIAKRYDGVTVEMIKDINNLHNTNLKPGTRLKVIVNG